MIDCCNEREGIMLIGCSIDVTNKRGGECGKVTKVGNVYFFTSKTHFFSKKFAYV